MDDEVREKLENASREELIKAFKNHYWKNITDMNTKLRYFNMLEEESDHNLRKELFYRFVDIDIDFFEDPV